MEFNHNNERSSMLKSYIKVILLINQQLDIIDYLLEIDFNKYSTKIL